MNSELKILVFSSSLSVVCVSLFFNVFEAFVCALEFYSACDLMNLRYSLKQESNFAKSDNRTETSIKTHFYYSHDILEDLLIRVKIIQKYL